MEELNLDEFLGSGFEFWSQRSSGICGSFVLTLIFGNVLLELLV